MKYIVRIALLAIIVFLSWMLVNSILDPIKEAEIVKAKEKAIVEKLKVIREAQLAFMDIHDSFTGNFDTLIHFMKHGNIKVVRAYGDKDDSTTVFKEEISMLSVRDSLFSDVDIDNIRYLPDNDTLEFKIEAGYIWKNNVKVPVFQVTDPEPYSKERKKEKDPLRVGNINDVDYNGNWSKDL